MRYKSGGSWLTSSQVFVKSGGAWRDCVGAWVKSGGTWRKVFTKAGGGGAFTIAGFSPSTPITKLRIGVGSQTQAVTVSLSGGTGPFTYSWSVVSDNAGGSIISGGSTVTATYQTMSVSPNATRQTVLRCTVTDTGDGSRQQTADCTINWEWEAV